MKNYKAVISYVGTGFSGVAEQVTSADEKPIRTVVGELRPIIEMVCQGVPTINVSGRTDKGVHAREQVITFSFPDGSIDFDPTRLAHVANKKLNPEIVIHSIEHCADDFHARFSAKARTYRYFIDIGQTPNIFLSQFSWNVYDPLDLEAMKAASKYFVGEQNFTSVSKSDESVAHNIREVFKAEFIDVDFPELFDMPNSSRDTFLCFEISANAFCWNMVRSIVGVLVDVGRGKLDPDEIPVLLAKQDRSVNQSQLAPPNGLVLWEVAY